MIAEDPLTQIITRNMSHFHNGKHVKFAKYPWPSLFYDNDLLTFVWHAVSSDYISRMSREWRHNCRNLSSGVVTSLASQWRASLSPHLRPFWPLRWESRGIAILLIKADTRVSRGLHNIKSWHHALLKSGSCDISWVVLHSLRKHFVLIYALYIPR